MKKNAIIISISSDIGTELAKKWCNDGWNIYGTYRTMSKQVDLLKEKYNIKLTHCDLTIRESIQSACLELYNICPEWDVLILATGRQEPVGNFDKTLFHEWEESVQVNLLAQLHIVYELLPYRNLSSNLVPMVLFFAGGGTNNAVLHYSSYTMSKIALIKMCELLDAEIPDTRFCIVGPGWVKTKIHQPTLDVGPKGAGNNYEKTKYKLSSDECTPMHDVINFCDWVANSNCNAIGGRNFSVVFDEWGTKVLETALEKDLDLYKLRRHGNDKRF